MADDTRPRLSRYNSVMPSSPTHTYIGESSRGTQLIIPWSGGRVTAGRAGSLPREPSASDLRRLVPAGYRYAGRAGNGIRVVKVDGPDPVMGPTVAESRRYVDEHGTGRMTAGQVQERTSAYQAAISQEVSRRTSTLNGVVMDGSEEARAAAGSREDAASIFAPLGTSLNGNATFLFDRSAPMTDLGTGDRQGVLASRGVFGSADSLERQLPAGRTTKTGPSENMMTVAGAVRWLRGLSVRDVGAYNHLVVMLRNAGYLSGSDDELPLGGYSTQVGQMFATAANDLSQANEAGDSRTLMEYLDGRGKAYADYLKERDAEEAAQAKEDEYQPIDRKYVDPKGIKAAAYDAARAVLGRKLTDEEEERLAATFRGREDAMYDEIDEAGVAETSFAVEQPEVGGTIDDYLDGDDFELERKQKLIGDYAQEFMRMMGVAQ